MNIGWLPRPPASTSSLRAEAAEQTRQRVLDAVYERLREAPSEKVSLDRIARMAGVSRSTVYLVFGSRGGLFSALGADLLRRGGYESVLLASAHRDVLRALYSMAQLDPAAVGRAVERMERGRAAGATYRAQRLSGSQVLRTDVAVDDAADLLWALTSFESFDLLYAGRSQTVGKISEALCAAAERSLCV